MDARVVTEAPVMGRSVAETPFGRQARDRSFLAQLARSMVARRMTTMALGRASATTPIGLMEVPQNRAQGMAIEKPSPSRVAGDRSVVALQDHAGTREAGVANRLDISKPGNIAGLDRTDRSSPPARQDPRVIWRLEDYPRPPGDTGRGFHWVPTLRSSPEIVDRFVEEAKALKASWVVILNEDANIGDNDYLVRRLVENGIEPIMRIYTPNGRPIQGDLTAMVRHYRALGVAYFQPYNEPNLPVENPDGRVSVDSYLDRWIPAARAIVKGGGLPGFGALAPAAPVDDLAFLRTAIERLRQRGALDTLDRAWISVHNYLFNRPVGYQDDSNGFLKFRWYDRIVREAIGRSLPIIGTEGGATIGQHLDPRYPPVDEARRDALVLDAYRYLPRREPYFFAFTYWVLANEAGGGHDPAFRDHALFKPDGTPTTLALRLRDLA